MFFFQSGLPNQMPNFSITSPRHFAARKCPSSWTMIIRLKITRTSRRMRGISRMCRSMDERIEMELRDVRSGGEPWDVRNKSGGMPRSF